MAARASILQIQCLALHVLPSETGAIDPNASCGASTAASYFVAPRLLRLLSHQRLQYAAGEFVICLAGFLRALCMFFVFLANVLVIRVRKRE